MPDAFAALHLRFRDWITHRYFVRVHMALMLSLVVLSGAIASRLLSDLGLRWIVVRYPLAVAFSYLVFFLLVRVWRAYAIRVRRARAGATSGSGEDRGTLDGSFSFSGGSGSGASGFPGGSGRFGGAGASASWSDEGADGPARAVAIPLAPGGGTSRSGGGSGGGGLDLDGDGAVILIAFVVAAGIVFGAGVYLVWQAPAILSEVAFQGALAGGLVKASRDMHEEGWAQATFEATRVPFFVSLAAALAFGIVARHYCPSASTPGEVFRFCVWRRG